MEPPKTAMGFRELRCLPILGGRFLLFVANNRACLL
uniref:Uncharacterized protein n=1 Tax=Arundo donax TaxID=35708 RepID=A0A0A8Y4F3_ARUDO